MLKNLNGYSVIERVIQRAKLVRECDDVILCTSTDNQDLPLVRIAKENDIYYYNGSSEDVLQRLLDAALLHNLDYIIGMTADNPLFSLYYANVISDTVRANPSLDYIYSSGNPIGMNVYAIKTKALQVICKVKEEVDTEIWGRLINRPEIFNVQEIHTDTNNHVDLDRVTLDEPADYEFLSEVFDNFSKDYVIEERDLNKLLHAQPEIAEINCDIVQHDLDESTKKRIDAFFKNNHESILTLKEKIYIF